LGEKKSTCRTPDKIIHRHLAAKSKANRVMDVNVLAMCLLLVELAVEVGGNVIPFIIFNHL
jgi:hypothetical protein